MIDKAYNVLEVTLFTFFLEKSLMEKVNQYFKDKINSLDDYYPFIRNDCKSMMCITQ